MADEGTGRAADVLAALADLTPSGEQRAGALTIPLEYFRWLPVHIASLFNTLTPEDRAVPPARLAGAARYTAASFDAALRVPIERAYGERLAAIAQVRTNAQPLRIGWLFVAGRLARGDAPAQRVFHPLVTVPVRVVRTPLIGYADLARAGDVVLSDLIPDGPERRVLERGIEYGGGALDGIREVAVSPTYLARLERLREFATAAAAAAGLPAPTMIPAGDNPADYLRRESLVVLAGVASYVAHETHGSSRAASLRAWVERADSAWTAFHSVYVNRPAVAGADPALLPPRRLDSPYLLTPSQRAAVERSRHEPVTVVSGAPGTGKSQTVVAMACDALSRGETVLVTARSDATVDALVDLFERAPGPQPVVFGSNERRVALARRLEDGALTSVPPEAVAQAQKRLADVIGRRDRCGRECIDALRIEVVARDRHLLIDARRIAPDLVDGRVDVAEMRELLRRAAETGGWWLQRWRARRARARACELAGVSPATGLAELRHLTDTAAAAAQLRRAALPGAEVPAPPYDELDRLEADVRDAAARWLAVTARSSDRMGSAERRAVAVLATALRSGRAARREQLTRLDSRLAHALPLWVGSLPDVDDLLPQVAGLFDVVLVDESSSVDQPLAAPALLRGRRGVVVGDPRQLRHVSFMSDQRRGSVLDSHDIDGGSVAALLDVRRNSLFDVAAASGGVTRLDEHFRSDPHLVEYVAERVYDGAFAVATRSPLTHDRDCIFTRRCDGRRDDKGVVTAEVTAVITELRGLLRSGARSVGALTPFRAQADAVEAAALAAFSVDELQQLDLRIGTVHAFQGNERDIVLVSLGIGPDDGPATWRFAEDPHLFAVLATRARRRLLLFHSADPPPGGLLAGYIAQADSPPGPPRQARRLDPWAGGIADELADAGVDVLRAYPVGRHVVDICVLGRPAPTAVVCSLHEDGEVAHVDRHVDLRRAGWDVHEALPARWSAQRSMLMVSLLRALGGQLEGAT